MKILLIVPLIVGIAAAIASAETFWSVPIAKLKFEEDSELVATALEQQVHTAQLHRLDGRVASESYLAYDGPADWDLPQNGMRLVYAGEAELPIKGVLDLVMDSNAGEMRTFRFTIPEGSAQEIKQEEFDVARKVWAEVHAQQGYPGKAWFAHQSSSDGSSGQEGFSSSDLSGTFDIFTGGRAIADNLALERDLFLGVDQKVDEELVAIEDIKGVTVKAIDWSRHMPKGEVAVDPLSAFIPEDQHALFAPSLHGLLSLMKHLEGEATPLSGLISSESSYHGLLQRYRRQLGMDMNDAAARLLPVLSVAVTGGDPYYATGTDVAILMQTDKPAVLLRALELAVAAQTGAKPVSQTEENLERVSYVDPNQGIASHLCRIGDMVFVTNSMAQVRRLSEVANGKVSALGASDEFKVFRHRYPKSSEDEDAFIFLSDATIRRWAGPVTRIGASRRNRALVALNELTCRGIASNDQDQDENYASLLGQVAMVENRAISSEYGSANFLTPISELGLTHATPTEKQAYEEWRRGYEQGWREVFDPIAIQLKIDEDSVDVDLTVLPLNVNSEIRQIMDIAADSNLSVRSRTRSQGSIMRIACAIDADNEMFGEFDQQLISMMPELKIKPLSWVGGSVSLDFLDSLFWQVFGQADTFSNITKVPVVARVEVKSKLKLGLFLTALRGMVQTTAPDTMEWANRKHGEKKYVVIAQQEDEYGDLTRICYAIMDDALLLALDEDHLQRAMDIEQMDFSEKQLATVPQAKSLMLDVDPAALAVLDGMPWHSSGASRLASVSWQAIPILNEWRRLFPDEDPQKVHQRLFGVSINCPAGMGYRWNEEHLTMESVVFGHRGAPRDSEIPAQGFEKYGRIHSGIDFEDGGLRLRLHLGPKVELPSLPQPEVGKVLGSGADLIGLKPGKIFHYSGEDQFGKQEWTSEVVSVEKDPKGLIVKTSEPWTDGEDQSLWKNCYLIADDGVWILAGNDQDYSMTYHKLPLSLPSKLRLHEVHSNDADGESVYEEGDEKEISSFHERMKMKVIGVEDVEVKAGKFENCVVVERRLETFSDGYFDAHNSREWYHPAVGLVKEVDKQGGVWELSRIEEK